MFPLWKWIPAKVAHALSPIGLTIYAAFKGSDQSLVWQPFDWNGIHFPNRLGIAGGVDKNAQHILDWQSLGAGFIEIGTITPEPQTANPGKIIDRLWGQKTLWNKMGFPNLGQSEIFYNLKAAQSECRLAVFANIGKNRTTSNQDASEDYRILTEKFAPEVQALVVNVSSPNTSGLRDLQSGTELKNLVEKVVLAASNKPVLVKLSPDMSTDQLELAVDASLSAGAKGFVFTNTTLDRESYPQFPKEGGLSGSAVALRSLATLKSALAYLGERRKGLLIVSAGGVLTAQDIKERISVGADLVQVYSVLVFEGPSFFQKVAQEFSA